MKQQPRLATQAKVLTPFSHTAQQITPQLLHCNFPLLVFSVPKPRATWLFNGSVQSTMCLSCVWADNQHAFVIINNLVSHHTEELE